MLKFYVKEFTTSLFFIWLTSTISDELSCLATDLIHVLSSSLFFITKTSLFKNIENFTTKKKNFQIKKILIFFHISAQNIDCGYSLEPPRRGDSKEYPQSMFLRRNKKNNVYPCKPKFYYIKVGFKVVKIIYACIRDVNVALGNKTYKSESRIYWDLLYWDLL